MANAFATEINRRLRPALDAVDYLSARWADEHEYEDFSEYVTALKAKTPETCTFVRATKRPFGFVVKTHDGVLLHIFATAKNIGWKVIPRATF